MADDETQSTGDSPEADAQEDVLTAHDVRDALVVEDDDEDADIVGEGTGEYIDGRDDG